MSKRQTAYHEAGHACVGIDLGFTLVSLTICPDVEHKTRGHARWRADPRWFDPSCADLRSRDWMEKRVMVLFSGLEAVTRLTGRRSREPAGNDIGEIIARSLHLYRPPVLAHWMRFMLARATAWMAIDHNWRKVEAVAGELLARETLPGERVRRICLEVARKHPPAADKWAGSTVTRTVHKSLP
jgi:ATP-dependent Zn protease